MNRDLKSLGQRKLYNPVTPIPTLALWAKQTLFVTAHPFSLCHREEKPLKTGWPSHPPDWSTLRMAASTTDTSTGPAPSFQDRFGSRQH